MHTLAKDQRGSALVMVLLTVVVLGIGLGVAGTTWSTLVQRSKEQELFWRGDQIRKAIESYYNVRHGGAPGTLPNSLDDLVKDPRSLQAKRHLRRAYTDPMTGGEFVLIKEGERIKGVKSSSTRKPFRQEGFPDEYSTFEGATSYDTWEFVFVPPSAKKKADGQTPGVRPPLPGAPVESK